MHDIGRTRTGPHGFPHPPTLQYSRYYFFNLNREFFRINWG